MDFTHLGSLESVEVDQACANAPRDRSACAVRPTPLCNGLCCIGSSPLLIDAVKCSYVSSGRIMVACEGPAYPCKQAMTKRRSDFSNAARTRSA